MIVKRLIISTCIPALLMCAETVSSQNAYAEQRTWTDSSGKFSVEAEFIEIKDGKVKLKRSDNDKILSIPLERLSKGDREYAEQRGSQINDLTDQPRSTEEMRTWTYFMKGKFSTDAQFVGIEENKVTLRRSNGSLLKVPLSKLSVRDRRFALDRKNLLEAEQVDPFDLVSVPLGNISAALSRVRETITSSGLEKGTGTLPNLRFDNGTFDFVSTTNSRGQRGIYSQCVVSSKNPYLGGANAVYLSAKEWAINQTTLELRLPSSEGQYFSKGATIHIWRLDTTGHKKEYGTIKLKRPNDDSENETDEKNSDFLLRQVGKYGQYLEIRIPAGIVPDDKIAIVDRNYEPHK